MNKESNNEHTRKKTEKEKGKRGFLFTERSERKSCGGGGVVVVVAVVVVGVVVAVVIARGW